MKSAVSPSKHLKTKLSELATASTQFGRTTQDNFRKEGNKEKKKKKENRNPMGPVLSLDEPEEYIFLDNNFISLVPQEASILQEKLLTNRTNQIYLSSPSSLPREHQLANELRGEKQPERIFEEFLEYEDSSRTSRKESVSSAQGQFVSNNLSIVQLYFVNKVKIIQRWWKKFYHQTKQNPKPEP